MSSPDLVFYFNVRNREQALCQLVGKALAQGLEIVVHTASESASHEVDRLLWSVPQTGFLPHCPADDARATRTPVIVDHRAELLPDRAVVFNWTSGTLTPAAACQRLIEIVDQDEDNRLRARDRWRSYQSAGLTPRAIDLQELASRG
ncbi:DNA polymerase III subunit chi [Chitinilyticum litopenaei]|uniref:DNA polymerase III subunit chi n=1 Tax=Chitinilyticum litopenaei TaxID=1121276 RepID=UPI0004113CF6|nr:DNA polymerase III subunit chi [Chitinilyticum litopenaei]